VHLELAFSYNTTKRTTRGIIRTVDQDQLDAFLRELKSLRHLASQPLVLGLAALEAILSRIPLRLDNSYRDICAIQLRTGHLGGLNPGSENLQDSPNYDQVSREVSRISQQISWYYVLWKSYLHLCDFMAQSATRSDAFGDENILGYPTRSSTTGKHSEIFSELLSANRSRIIHHLDALNHYKELCAVQNQNVYNLIAQRDVQQNIELARDSKSIAVASKRDSSA